MKKYITARLFHFFGSLISFAKRNNCNFSWMTYFHWSSSDVFLILQGQLFLYLNGNITNMRGIQIVKFMTQQRTSCVGKKCTRPYFHKSSFLKCMVMRSTKPSGTNVPKWWWPLNFTTLSGTQFHFTHWQVTIKGKQFYF